MSDEPSDHRAGIIIAVSTMGAMLAALLLYLGVWMASNPGAGLGDAVGQLTSSPRGSDMLSAFLAAGGLAGFLSSSFALGVPAIRRIIRAAAGAALFVLGGLVGAFFGVLAYLAYWIATHPGDGIVESLVRLPEAYTNAQDPLGAFLLAGAMAGLAGAAYVLGAHLMRRVANSAAGAVLGGVAGLSLFSMATVILARPGGGPEGIMVAFAQAVYSFSPLEAIFVSVGASVGFLMARYSWRLYGLFTFVALVSVVLGYLVYTLGVTLPRVPSGNLPVALVLFAAETATLIMVVLYSFYTLDVASRKRWRRGPQGAVFSRFFMPKVAFQVPAFNEPPELVIQTLRKLLAMDYPQDMFVVMMLDDSTKPECSDPLREFCRQNGVVYIHRKERGGYKAGALNNAMRYTPRDVELIAVVDADYHVEPEYLRETVGYFVDPKIAWLQTPQDYRNKSQSFLTEQYYLADAYFYRTVLPSRNEENSIIFCGTMGILRKSALEQVGGWGEEFITEDAELSVRLIDKGWRSLYVNKTYGRGLIPPTFEGYKRQHYRWAFGGAKILRGHYKTILFGNFTPRQRFDYFVSSIHWFEGLFVLAIGMAVLALGLAEVAGVEVATHHSQEILLIGLVPLFLLTDGITRMHMVLRKTMGLSFGGTARVMGMWFSVKFSNMFASLKALMGVNIPFVRTPKAPEQQVPRGEAFRRALRLTPFESTMSTLFLVTSLAVVIRTAATFEPGTGMLVRYFLAFWLLYYALVFSAAPIYAYKSYVSFRPDGQPAAAIVPQGVPQ